MKLSVPILSASVVLALAAPLIAEGLGLGVTAIGSPHNFADNIGHPERPSAGGWNQRDDICGVCHVAHDGNRDTFYGEIGLLWNHALSNTTYTMYDSFTLDGAQALQPTGYSKMCLGCHDGTVGIDTFDMYPGGLVFMEDYNPANLIPGPLYGVDLGSTHPISIEYNERADPHLHSRTSPMGGSGTIADVLEQGITVQCSSCHDVHDEPGESVPGTHLLRIGIKVSDGIGSGLCRACHIK